MTSLYGPPIWCPSCGLTLRRLAAYGRFLNVHEFKGHDVPQAILDCPFGKAYLDDGGAVFDPRGGTA